MFSLIIFYLFPLFINSKILVFTSYRELYFSSTYELVILILFFRLLSGVVPSNKHYRLSSREEMGIIRKLIVVYLLILISHHMRVEPEKIFIYVFIGFTTTYVMIFIKLICGKEWDVMDEIYNCVMGEMVRGVSGLRE